MPRSEYEFDEAKIARFLKEGTGRGPDYKPWLRIQGVPSHGRIHRIVGRVTGRIHHLLSDLEYRTLLIYDWSRIVTDIREQFPLDRDDTRRIASAKGVQHPADPHSGTDLVMTTDFVIDMAKVTGSVTVARAVKPSADLDDLRTLEKLEIERRYWTEKGVDWGIVTERELPVVPMKKLHKLVGHREFNKGPTPELVGMIDRELPSWPEATLREFADAMDLRFGLEPGRALAVVLHLLATGKWIFDLEEPVDEATPLARFARRAGTAGSAESGVRPCGWTRSRGGFGRGAGGAVLELGGAEIPLG
jgi:hypothetical protein